MGNSNIITVFFDRQHPLRGKSTWEVLIIWRTQRDGFPRQSADWLGMTVLTRAAALGGEYPGTAVEGEAAAVATGSGSEAVAESCGGTVLLTDNGTRENRLREKHEANSRQGAAR